MMNCAQDIAKSSPLLAVRPRASSLACHADLSRRSPALRGEGGSAFETRSLPINASPASDHWLLPSSFNAIRLGSFYVAHSIRSIHILSRVRRSLLRGERFSFSIFQFSKELAIRS